MDDYNDYSIDENPVTARLLAFVRDNLTAGDVKGVAFEIGISPDELEGALAEELGRSLIGQMAQRGELELLDRALRDLWPVAYGQWMRDGED